VGLRLVQHQQPTRITNTSATAAAAALAIAGMFSSFVDSTAVSVAVGLAVAAATRTTAGALATAPVTPDTLMSRVGLSAFNERAADCSSAISTGTARLIVDSVGADS
jgi:hypothetical protein